MTTEGEHTGVIVGVRLDHNGPVVFCRYDDDARAARPALARGQRVRVDPGKGLAIQEGVVAISPEQVIAAPPLDGAPRIVAAIPPGASGTTHTDADAGIGSQGLPGDARGPIVSAEGDADLSHADASPPANDADLTPTFLPADDADLTPADLARALGLAALPLPEAPPPRERDGERRRQ